MKITVNFMKSPRGSSGFLFKRPPFDKRVVVGFVLTVLALWTVGLFTIYFSPHPPTTLSIVSRGTFLIIIRLPPTPGHLQEDVTVAGDGSQKDPRKDIRGPSDAARSDVSITGYTRRPLTALEWEALNAVRMAWCQHPSQLQPVRVGDTFYDIALRCGDNYESKAFLVPPNQLPEPFAALIKAVPSPQGMR